VTSEVAKVTASDSNTVLEWLVGVVLSFYINQILVGCSVDALQLWAQWDCTLYGLRVIL